MSASAAPADLLLGKVAIVTGASMGIGEACAEYSGERRERRTASPRAFVGPPIQNEP
jgi:hypothetical protein